MFFDKLLLLFGGTDNTSCMFILPFFQAFFFGDYWEDIGTIKSFYDANMALTEEVSSRIKILTN
jgi:ADP-glucose pyrophosphorylase